MNREPLPLETIIARPRGEKWRVGAVMLTGGERYYQLINTQDEKDVALLPWFEVEPWAEVPDLPPKPARSEPDEWKPLATISAINDRFMRAPKAVVLR